MRAHVVSIGSELTHGHLTDTNATFLAQQLAGLGIELLYVTQVGDDRARLAGVIRSALSEAEVVICTGGVGPTEDDLTREAIADVVGEDPVIQPELVDAIEAFFRARGMEMPERNKKQAWLIPSAEALPNPVGTAPGWFVRTDGRCVAAMPGVPREMFRMWREQVIPRLGSMLGGRVVRSTTIRTIGIGESALEQVIHDIVSQPDPVIGTYAKDDGVHVRVTAVAPTEAEALAKRDATAAEITSRLERYVYGYDDTTLPRAVLGLVAKRGLTMAIADRGGAGRFAALLGGDPEAAKLITAAETRFSGGESAETLASAAAAKAPGGIGVGITLDVTEVGNGVYEGPIEVAVSGAFTNVERFPMRAAYEDLQRRSALTACDVVRRTLLGL